ncbi:hypothetical protein AVEN_160425-1 [Araneus ventricosus]|uniref:Uncharacterized protein n=1 Tax=Araneus ventricosus TaxID=182803 RepID=A0A4Y2QBY7_ARAVE|nr:hypothetical protein AVEN_160425-1 [Araneus ventricosus]
MPIPSSIPQQEKSAYISQNSSATARSDVILQILYAAGEGRLSFSELNSAKSICSNLLVEEKLSRTLESLGNIESLGVSSPDERLEDEEALRFFENSILQKNDRYEVDDFICGTNTVMEASEVYHNANTIMKKASMTLTKWNSNSPSLRKEYETGKYKDSTPLCDS